MTALDDLAAMQGTPDVIAAAEQLAVLWNLPGGVAIRAARSFGAGSRVPVEIDLSNGETMTFESVRDMTRPANLAAEIVACAGVYPKLTQAQAGQSVALVLALATRERALGDNEIAADWGGSYLQSATVIDLDLNSQAERWAAFGHLERHEPEIHDDGTRRAPCGLVLRHLDGTRLVRCGWFAQYVRTLDVGVSQTALAARMARVGWTRRGGSGRIKATAPGRHDTCGWNFWTVPDGWENTR